MSKVVSEQEVWRGDYKELNKMLKDIQPKVKDSINDMFKFQDEFLNANFPSVTTRPNISINNRFKRIEGQFQWGKHVTPRIQMNGDTIAMELLFFESLEHAFNTLSHELVHFGLKELDKPFDDGDIEFEQMLNNLHIQSSTDTNDSDKFNNTEETAFYRYNYYLNTKMKIAVGGQFKTPRKYTNYNYFETKVFYATFK